MARPLLFSNGEMHVALDKFGSVREFYFPFVGQENHAGERASAWKIGVFSDGKIHWLDDGNWQISEKFLGNNLVGITRAKNENLALEIVFEDFVDAESNVFARNIHILNLANFPREIKLFLHQSFIISESRDGHDTAQFLPKNALKNQNFDAILHFKGKRFFVVSGEKIARKKFDFDEKSDENSDDFSRENSENLAEISENNFAEFDKNPTNFSRDFDGFSVGIFGEYSGETFDGVWRDAEDGILAQNPCARGTTDSILQFDFEISPLDSARAHYFLAAGKNLNETVKILAKFRAENLTKKLTETANFWGNWLAPAKTFAEVKIAPKYRENFLNSLLIAKSLTDRRGAIIASTDTEMLKNTRDAYVDCWPRDAANVFSAFLRVGYFDETRNFLNFARDVLTDDGYFWQMYRPDASFGPNSHAWLKNLEKSENSRGKSDKYFDENSQNNYEKFDNNLRENSDENYQNNYEKNLRNSAKNYEILPPIQTDETARVLILFNQAFEIATEKNHEKLATWRELYENLAKKCANFLANYINSETKLPLPSYELWEVRHETTLFTTSLTAVALFETAKIAEKFGFFDDANFWRKTAIEMKNASGIFWNEKRNYFYRGIFDDGNFDETIDIASFYSAFLARDFEFFDDEKLARAEQTFRERLKITDENLMSPRFENDDYNGFENPWFIASLWLSKFDLKNSRGKFAKKTENFAQNFDGNSENNFDKNFENSRENFMENSDFQNAKIENFAQKILDFTNDFMNKKNILPEQFSRESGEMLSAAPLAWSHGEFLNALIDFGNPENNPFKK